MNTCACGQPVKARGKCRDCLASWYKATNPYKKRSRPRSPLDRMLRRELAARRQAVPERP